MQVDIVPVKRDVGLPSESQVSDYIVALLDELCDMATSRDADFLAYLLRLASIEAENLRDPSDLKTM